MQQELYELNLGRRFIAVVCFHFSVKRLVRWFCPPMSIEINFEGKIALITGASQGIGAQMARTFHRAGAMVVLYAPGELHLPGGRRP